jgi:hypothetical protein
MNTKSVGNASQGKRQLFRKNLVEIQQDWCNRAEIANRENWLSKRIIVLFSNRTTRSCGGDTAQSHLFSGQPYPRCKDIAIITPRRFSKWTEVSRAA